VIRTNLSTRPFYNQRVVRLFLLLLAAIVVAASIFNVTRILRYSSSDTRLATQASRDEARAAELRQEAAALRASVDLQQVELASVGARQANDLIDRRTFSWTELLNRFEATLSDDARITSVRPRLDREFGIVLRVVVAARGVSDVEQFIDSLEATGAFRNVRAAEEHFDEEGLFLSTLEMGYSPASAKPAEDKPAQEKPPAETAQAAPDAPARGTPPAEPGRGERGTPPAEPGRGERGTPPADPEPGARGRGARR
jgi:type IV pilus assembly protein PilN